VVACELVAAAVAVEFRVEVVRERGLVVVSSLAIAIRGPGTFVAGTALGGAFARAVKVRYNDSVSSLCLRVGDGWNIPSDIFYAETR